MSKSQNIHDTRKWKKRRKNHAGDRCHNPHCGICVPHKILGNSLKLATKKQMIEEEFKKKNYEEDYFDGYPNDDGWGGDIPDCLQLPRQSDYGDNES